MKSVFLVVPLRLVLLEGVDPGPYILRYRSGVRGFWYLVVLSHKYSGVHPCKCPFASISASESSTIPAKKPVVKLKSDIEWSLGDLYSNICSFEGELE